MHLSETVMQLHDEGQFVNNTESLICKNCSHLPKNCTTQRFQTLECDYDDILI